MKLSELIQAQEEARTRYQLSSEYVERMRLVRVDLDDARKQIKVLNKTLDLVKEFCKTKEFSLEPIFGVPKKQIYEMDAAELQEANKAVTERQKGKHSWSKNPFEVYQPQPTPEVQARIFLERQLDRGFGVGIDEMSKIAELRRKYEADLAQLLKDADAEVGDFPIGNPR